MKNYKVLKTSVFKNENFKIIPIRYEDRFEIMQWRNEQIYHLRQAKPLTEEDQENYFKNVIAPLLEKENPNQILFSFLHNDQLIGYGGLVHINWMDRNAEISFIMNTELEKNCFQKNWSEFLNLLEKVAYDDLGFHKVYVYAFDLRPHLYKALEINAFSLDARLSDHCLFNGEYKDVVIYSKIKE